MQMQQTPVIFFNHWHHGDLFTSREMIADIISQFPQFRFFYAHRCHRKIISDIVTHITDYAPVLNSIGEGNKIDFFNNAFLFNTWIGAWGEAWHKHGHRHPSRIEHYEIYGFMYDYARFKFGWDVKLKNSVWDYVPTINYEKFNLEPVKQFMKEHPKAVLFSNNDARSEQTNIGNMQEIIEELARKYDGLAFVATQKFITNLPNIFFTSDIIKEECDLNEISYMSTLCPVLVGKNSSPSTYFNTKQNYKDPNKIIIDFSKDIRDCLPNGLDMPAEFRFSDSVDHNTLVDIVSCAIKEKY